MTGTHHAAKLVSLQLAPTALPTCTHVLLRATAGEMALVYFDAMGEAGASREPPRCTTRCTGLACCEPMRPPLSDHVTPRLRMTSVAASLKAGGSEGGPADTCAGKGSRRAGCAGK